jgi:hypothetical protein
MKKAILALALMAGFAGAKAQGTLGKGNTQLNAGVGLSSWGIPVYVGFDYGVHKDITIGLEGSFRSYNESWTNQKYRHSIIGFSGNGNYHFNTIFNMPSKWDLYAGLNIGFYIWNSPSGYGGGSSSGLGLGGQVGARYFVSKAVGLNLEFGGGNAFSGGKFGLTFKL